MDGVPPPPPSFTPSFPTRRQSSLYIYCTQYYSLLASSISFSLRVSNWFTHLPPPLPLLIPVHPQIDIETVVSHHDKRYQMYSTPFSPTSRIISIITSHSSNQLISALSFVSFIASRFPYLRPGRHPLPSPFSLLHWS